MKYDLVLFIKQHKYNAYNLKEIIIYLIIKN